MCRLPNEAQNSVDGPSSDRAGLGEAADFAYGDSRSAADQAERWTRKPCFRGPCLNLSTHTQHLLSACSEHPYDFEPGARYPAVMVSSGWNAPLTPLVDEADDAARGRIWTIASLVAAGLSAGFAAYRMTYDDIGRAALDLVVSLAFILSARDLVRTGRLRRAVLTSGAASLLGLVPSVLYGDAMGPVTFLWYGMLPIAATLATGRSTLLVVLSFILPLPLLPPLLSALGLASAAVLDIQTALALTTAFGGLGLISLGYETLHDEAKEERDHVRDQLKKLQEDTADLISARDQFVRNVSHEFRTPLNHILGATELLNDTELSEEQLELVEMASSSGQDLLELIDEALAVHDLERGDVRLSKTPFDPIVLFEDIRRKFAPTMKDKGLQFAVQLDADTPTELVGDPKLVFQLVSNLLENALAFTPEGRITLRVNYEGSDVLRVEVEDSGVGIPEEEQERIFKAFHQVDASDRRAHGGLGTGLAVSQRLAELMGGEIQVQSKEGQGSLFSVDLRMNSKARPFEQPSDGRNSRARDERILLAEPNHRSLTAFTGTLHKVGLRPTGVSSTQDLLEALGNDRYDVVFVANEFAMASEVLEQLSSARRKGAYVVGLRSQETRDLPQSRRSAFHDQLPKPLRREQVLETLKQVNAS